VTTPDIVEPPIGSVVLDCDGVAWQHLPLGYYDGKRPDGAPDSGWYSIWQPHDGKRHPLPFWRLLMLDGPVILVHTGHVAES
jgi:hypothetical protein